MLLSDLLDHRLAHHLKSIPTGKAEPHLYQAQINMHMLHTEHTHQDHGKHLPIQGLADHLWVLQVHHHHLLLLAQWLQALLFTGNQELLHPAGTKLKAVRLATTQSRCEVPRYEVEHLAVAAREGRAKERRIDEVNESNLFTTLHSAAMQTN